MTSLLTLTPDLIEERPAKSSLPWVWFGFFFVAAFLIEETLMFVLEMDEAFGTFVLIAIGLAGWIFWLFCVYRFHKVLKEVSANSYPISGGEAVGKHFIPFYNLVWVFRWPNALSDYVNRRGRVKMVSGNLLGVVLLVSMLISRFFDGAIGLTATFAVGMYISAKLRRHIEFIGEPSKLPPPPDPAWFKDARPAENQEA